MKKLVSLLLVMLMCFSLAACGDSGKGGSDANAGSGAVVDDALKPLANLYNELAPLYNEASAAAEENGWMDDEQTALEIQLSGVMLGSIGEMLTSDPSALDGVDLDELYTQLEQLGPGLQDLIERVSVPYGG